MNLAITIPQPQRESDAVYQISYESFEINSNPKAQPLPNKPVRQKTLQYHNIQIPPQNQKSGTSVVHGIAYCVRNKTVRSPSPSCTLGLKKGRGKCKIQNIAEEFREEIKQAENGERSPEEEQLLRDLRRLRRMCGEVDRGDGLQEYHLNDEEKLRIEKSCRTDSFINIVRRNSRSFRSSFSEAPAIKLSEKRHESASRNLGSLINAPEEELPPNGLRDAFLGISEEFKPFGARPQSAFASKSAASRAVTPDFCLLDENSDEEIILRPATHKNRPDSANLFSICDRTEYISNKPDFSEDNNNICENLQELGRIDEIYTYNRRDRKNDLPVNRFPIETGQKPSSAEHTRNLDNMNIISRDQSLISETFAEVDRGFILAQARSRHQSPQVSRRRSTICDTFSFYK